MQFDFLWQLRGGYRKARHRAICHALKSIVAAMVAGICTSLCLAVALNAWVASANNKASTQSVSRSQLSISMADIQQRQEERGKVDRLKHILDQENTRSTRWASVLQVIAASLLTLEALDWDGDDVTISVLGDLVDVNRLIDAFKGIEGVIVAELLEHQPNIIEDHFSPNDRSYIHLRFNTLLLPERIHFSS